MLVGFMIFVQEIINAECSKQNNKFKGMVSSMRFFLVPYRDRSPAWCASDVQHLIRNNKCQSTYFDLLNCVD